MATSLIHGASSAYISAQNTLRGIRTLPEIYVYVEGLDDVAFWKECLRPFCSNFSFKVTQLRRSDGSIAEGKRHLIESVGLESLGPHKYVAVDADYDWIIDNYRPSSTSSSISEIIRQNPYILHTFIYSIENYKCHPLCLAAMMDKISGWSEENDLRDFLMSVSLAMANLFLIHLVSTDNCDGVYTLKDFRKDIDTLTMNMSSMRVDKKGLGHIGQREDDLKDYLELHHNELESYRQKLNDLGFDERRYYLLMQGHIVEDILVKKHLPGKILEVRRRVLAEIHRGGCDEQIAKRVRQFERITGIADSNASGYPKPTNALLRDIRSRLDQLLDDCTNVSNAEEGYVYLRDRLEKAFGKNLGPKCLRSDQLFLP